MWLRRALAAAGLAVLGLAAGCDTATRGDSAGAAPSLPEGRRIVTTCAMVTDIVRQVAGDEWQVEGLMGEGTDPHLYKPTRDDVKRLTEADVVFYSGLMLEGRMGDTFAKVARQGKPVYPVTEGIDESLLREPPEFAGHWDPHVWMDAALWSRAVEFVAGTLAQLDPPHAADYHARGEAYRAELTKLDDYCRQVIHSIPQEQRVLVTAHDAFGYFSKAYDIEVRSVQGISTESEPSLDDITRLVDFLVERHIGAIFVESSVNQKNIQALIEGAADQQWTVKIGGKLYSDAMGPPGTYEGTYLGMIDHNATTIARALGGQAPERGLNGKLSGAP
jgi:manganese/zinc/iron transport system substrate-binding protein